MLEENVIYVERDIDGTLLCGTELEISFEKKRRRLKAMEDEIRKAISKAPTAVRHTMWPSVPIHSYKDSKAASRQ